MHSRIFQVSKKPIEDLITSDRYYEGMVNGVADYVIDIDESDYPDEYFWAFNGRPGISYNADEKCIVIEDKEAALEGSYTVFVTTLHKMLDVIDTEEFTRSFGELSRLMYLLKDAWSDKYGYYIDDNGEYAGLETLNDFIRSADLGTRYYLGAVIDYHY